MYCLDTGTPGTFLGATFPKASGEENLGKIHSGPTSDAPGVLVAMGHSHLLLFASQTAGKISSHLVSGSAFG